MGAREVVGELEGMRLTDGFGLTLGAFVGPLLAEGAPDGLSVGGGLGDTLELGDLDGFGLAVGF